MGSLQASSALLLHCTAWLVHNSHLRSAAFSHFLCRLLPLAWLQVVQLLLPMHESQEELTSTAQTLNLSVDELLLQQTQYLAVHRTELSTDLQDSCRRGMRLLSSQGLLLPCSRLHLPPADPNTRSMLEDLAQSGASLHVLDSVFAELLEDQENRLVFTKLLRMQQADELAVISSMVHLHRNRHAQGQPVSGAQLLQHLSFLAQHEQLLEDRKELLQEVQEAIWLQDAAGAYRTADSLHFGLGSAFSSLHMDMHAAGMQFLHDSYMAAVSGKAQKQLGELLHLLGVRKADKTAVLTHILQLHKDQHSSGTISGQQLERHITFLADNLSTLNSNAELLATACKHLLLPDAAGVYRHPAELFQPLSAELADLHEDLTAAGMHFLHGCYTGPSTDSSGASTQPSRHVRKLQELLEQLGVQEASHQAVAEYLVQLHEQSSSPVPQQQRMRQLQFFADNLQLLGTQADPESRLLVRLQESLLLQDSAGQHRPAGELFMPLGQQFAELQTEIYAAGMPFLHSSYTAAATSGSKPDNISKARIRDLLTALGVSEADVSKVVQFILVLYRQPNSTAASTSTTSSTSSSNGSSSGVAAATTGSSSTSRLPGSHAAGLPLWGQHIGHVQFIYSNWQDLSAKVKKAVQQELQLYLQPGGSNSFSTAGVPGGSARSSRSLYLLPPKHSAERRILPQLQLGGAKFLSQEYLELTGLQEQGAPVGLQQWLTSALKLCYVQPADVVVHILTAHRRIADGRASTHSLEDIVQHGLYVAGYAATADLSDEFLQDIRQHLLLVRLQSSTYSNSSGSSSRNSGSGSSSASSLDDSGDSDADSSDGEGKHTSPGALLYRSASEGLLHWPVQGCGWQLQEVLLPSEVDYIHPDYVTGVQDAAAAESGLSAKQRERFFTGLGLQCRPVPGSPALQAAVDAGRWRPLLVMLSDIWSGYSQQERQLLAQQLRNMEVSTMHHGMDALTCLVVARIHTGVRVFGVCTSCLNSLFDAHACLQVQTGSGTQPLHACFAASAGASTEQQLLPLLRQLQLPTLDLPGWPFLQNLGVSTDLTWPTLLKALQQLSAGQSAPSVPDMRQLYNQVHALAIQSPDTATTVRAGFEEQPLLYVPGMSTGEGCWVTSRDVVWTTSSSRQKLFLTKTFIRSHYQVRSAVAVALQ